MLTSINPYMFFIGLTSIDSCICQFDKVLHNHLPHQIHVLVRVKNKTVQRVVMLFVLFVSFWAVKKVIFLDNWKTGYGIHGYMPTSWQ